MNRQTFQISTSGR